MNLSGMVLLFAVFSYIIYGVFLYTKAGASGVPVPKKFAKRGLDKQCFFAIH